jgi:hypothetical protein
MNRRPKRFLSHLARLFLLLFAPVSSTSATEHLYREFLSRNGVVSVSAEQDDDHHARITAIQITRDQYRETRILNGKTGAIDLLEFSDPNLQVTYSVPQRGRFSKLEIRRREQKGLRTAELILSSDGSHYIPIRHRFRPYAVFQQKLDFSASSSCFMPQSTEIQGTSHMGPVIAALDSSPANIASHLLDSSCQLPPFKADYSAILSGVSKVVASRDSKQGEQNRFLSCLSQHRLKLFAERAKGYFNDSLKSPPTPTVFCQDKDNGDRGQYFEEESKTYLLKPWLYGGQSKTGATDYYADTFYHETLHRTGIEDEDLTHDIVSCCGMESGSERTNACWQVDKAVTETNERNARLQASMEKLDGFKALWLKVEEETDEQRVNVFYDDFFNVMKASQTDGEPKLSQCTSSSGGDACIQNFISQTESKIASYFENDCRKRFRDQPKRKASELCQELKTQSIEMVRKNMTNVCDASKANAFERSCFHASMVQKDRLLAQAGTDGDLIDSPDATPDSPLLSNSKILRDSFLTGFAARIPNLEKAYNLLKEKFNNARDERIENMFFALINYMGGKGERLQAQYTTCLSKGKGADLSDIQSQCANDLKHSFFEGSKSLNHFFRKVCPTYFMTEENKEKPCKEINSRLVEVFEASFKSGCKTQDPSRRIGAPGNDLTCLFQAIQDAKNNVAHYSELVQAGKITNSDGKSMVLTSDQEADKIARRAQEVGRKNPKLAKSPEPRAREIPHLHRRAPISAQGAFQSFDPSEKDFADKLRQQFDQQQPSAVASVFQHADKVLDMAIPNAEADTARLPEEQASSAARAAQAISSGNVPTESNISENIDVVRNIKFGPNAKAKSDLNSQGEQTLNGKSNEINGRSPASTSATASAPSKQDGQRDPKDSKGSTGSSTTSKAGKSGRSGASDHRSSAGQSASSNSSGGDEFKSDLKNTNLTRQQYDFLMFFKTKPSQALIQLKSGKLEDKLNSNQVLATDDQGVPHGPESAHIRIKYDRSQRRFTGLPE